MTIVFLIMATGQVVLLVTFESSTAGWAAYADVPAFLLAAGANYWRSRRDRNRLRRWT